MAVLGYDGLATESDPAAAASSFLREGRAARRLKADPTSAFFLSTTWLTDPSHRRASSPTVVSMVAGDGFDSDETAPLSAVHGSPPPDPPTRLDASQSFEPGWPPVESVPAWPTTPMAPAGWYPANGEMRWWDGARWTEHRGPSPSPGPSSGQFYHPVSRPMILTDARTNAVEVAFAWVLTFFTLAYLLPWAIAATRGKSNSAAIGLLNFLLGWTFIGWVASLVMACMPHQVVLAQQQRY